ncbi:LOW QUALITY PROTEIN: hypothetical protein U9M48_004005, partial [Paspalum notatum var. saurae]
MSDLGSLRYFLGIEISSTPEGIYMSREKYIRVFLIVLLLPITRPRILLWSSIFTSLATDGELLDDPTRYRHIVGSLVYLGVTRPDISYSVHIRVVYRDATWASDSSDRRSLLAYCVFLGGSLIAWKTKKRRAVSRSSRVACYGSCDGRGDLVTLHIGAISIARDPVKHELTKHIGVDAYYTRARVRDDVITLRYVASELQLADFLTKARTGDQHRFYLSKLGVFDPPR